MIYEIRMDYGAGYKKLMEFDRDEPGSDMDTPIGEVLKGLLSFCPNGVNLEITPKEGGH